MLLVASGHQILAAKQFIETHKDRRSPTVLAPTLAGFNIATAAYAYTYVRTYRRIAPVWERDHRRVGNERAACWLDSSLASFLEG